MRHLICMFFVFTGLALAQDSQASSTAAPQIGLLVKNRSTSEMLALRCEKMEDGICTSFQFLLLSGKKDKFQILAKIGNAKNYQQFAALTGSIVRNVRDSYLDQSNIEVATSGGALDDVILYEHFTGVSTHLLANSGDSFGDKLWRITVGVITLPIFATIDLARYTAEVLMAGGEVAGQAAAVGLATVFHDVPNQIKTKNRMKKAEKILARIGQTRYANKVTRVSNKLFNVLKSNISNN